MASSHILRLATIKGKNGVLEALKHNKRELQAERGAATHINAAKTPLNYSLAGFNSASAIAKQARVQMLIEGIETPRKNGVMAIEILFSLPIDRHAQDTRPFFVDCLDWLKKTFKGYLLSFDVHLDESAPHAHAIILPLINGKMQGNKVMGGTGNLMRLINLFHKQVAYKYGMSKGKQATSSPNIRLRLEREIIFRLRGDSAMESSVWACIRDAIHDNPLPFAQLLGIEIPRNSKKTAKSFVQIMTSSGKGRINRVENTI